MLVIYPGPSVFRRIKSLWLWISYFRINLSWVITGRLGWKGLGSQNNSQLFLLCNKKRQRVPKVCCRWAPLWWCRAHCQQTFRVPSHNSNGWISVKKPNKQKKQLMSTISDKKLNDASSWGGPETNRSKISINLQSLIWQNITRAH